MSGEDNKNILEKDLYEFLYLFDYDQNFVVLIMIEKSEKIGRL